MNTAYTKNLFNVAYTLFSIILLTACDANHETGQKPTSQTDSLGQKVNTSSVEIGNDVVTATVALQGSAINSFMLKQHHINPLSWQLSPADMPENHKGYPPFSGHFLCVGRWGAPSEQEIKAGLMHNGDVNTGNWKLIFQKIESDGSQHTQLYFQSSKEQIQMIREFYVKPGSPVIYVTETIDNLKFNDRLFNWVQHPTIGAPFLSENTIIDCNAGLGFDQRQEPEIISKTAFKWPQGKLVDGQANLRLVTDPRSYVTTHIFDDTVKTGWVTATSPEHQLLIGYVFKTEEYPWLNLWHQVKDGKPFAHGLEFGTTGLGRPYPELLARCFDFFGHRSYIILPAKSSIKKSYLMFLHQVDKAFSAVKGIQLKNDSIYLTIESNNKIITQTLPAPYRW